MANVKDEAKKQAAKQKKKVGGFLAEFKEFALKGNVMSILSIQFLTALEM